MRLTFRCLVRPDLLLSTFAELIAYTKANPDKLNVGSSGMGTPPHLMAEMLKACAGRSLRSLFHKELAASLATPISAVA